MRSNYGHRGQSCGGQHRSPPLRLPAAEWAEKLKREARAIEAADPDWLRKFETELDRLAGEPSSSRYFRAN